MLQPKTSDMDTVLYTGSTVLVAGACSMFLSLSLSLSSLTLSLSLSMLEQNTHVSADTQAVLFTINFRHHDRWPAIGVYTFSSIATRQIDIR